MLGARQAGAHDRRASRRRGHRAPDRAGPGHGGGGGLPLAQPGRRRTEPHRPRAGRGAGADPHRGAARRPTAGRRPPVLHPRLRLRLLQDPGRDLAALAPGHACSRTWCASSGGSGPRSSCRSSAERRAMAMASTRRPAGRRGRRSRPRATPPVSRSWPGRRASLPWTPLKLYRSTRFDTHRHHPDARRRRARSGGGQVLSPDRDGRPQPAPLAGHGAAPGTGAVEGAAGTGRGSNRADRGHPVLGIDTTAATARLGDAGLAPHLRGGADLAGAAGAPAPVDRPAGVSADRLAHLDRAIVAASGVVCDARSDDDRVVPGQRITVALECWNTGTEAAPYGRAAGRAGYPPRQRRGHPSARRPARWCGEQVTATVAADAPPTRPYFHLRRPTRRCTTGARRRPRCAASRPAHRS